MATQTIVLATANSNEVTLSMDYNDVSNLITTARLANTGEKGTVIITLTDRTTNAVVFGPIEQVAKAGTKTQNLSGLGLHMTTIQTKFGPRLVPPFNASMEWDS